MKPSALLAAVLVWIRMVSVPDVAWWGVRAPVVVRCGGPSAARDQVSAGAPRT
jgi:hypothetical protein